MKPPLGDPEQPWAATAVEGGVLLVLAGLTGAVLGLAFADVFVVLGVLVVFLPVLVPLTGVALYLFALARETEET